MFKLLIGDTYPHFAYSIQKYLNPGQSFYPKLYTPKHVEKALHAKPTDTNVPGLNKPIHTEAEEEWVQKLIKLVENSLTDNKLTIEMMADAVHVSPRQLRRKLKTLTGFPPAKFIKEIQLQTARRELENNSVSSVAEIAFVCGFTYQATFSTLFKERFGVSPSEFRKYNRAS